ncbi:MAG: hypothetical protein DI539_28970 [Flavobacterium psychrophilum]|nr:MAG: hypothetical protein DI539_28970 [Flavobacterium psychrophilum]
MIEAVAKVKKRSIVYYTRFLKRKYNEKSKLNLVQNTNQNESKMLSKIRNQKEIHDINAYAETYKMAFENATKKTYKTALSKQQASKISEITNVFISSILSEYRPQYGFKQRSVTFALLTIPTETQNVSDKKIISQLVKFIDDIKRVKNYIIDPVTKQKTKECALPIENYVWRAETTENGVIHFHILFDSFVNKNTLKRVWNNHLEKLGFSRAENSASIQSIRNIKDVGAYITKYMTKPPLRDKYKNATKEVLDSLPDNEKYRRPVIGKIWGCSKAVLKLKFPEFIENDIPLINELSDQLKKIECPTLPDYVTVFAGNVKEKLKKCSIYLQGVFKWWYKSSYKMLYEIKKDIETVQQYLNPKKQIYEQLQFNFLQ